MARILAVLIITVVLAACSPDPASPPQSLGDRLELSGTVYTRDIDLDLENPEGIFLSLLGGSSDLISYSDADKNLELTISGGDLGGSGEIKNGKFGFSIEAPGKDNLISINEALSELLAEAASLPDGVVLPDIVIYPDDAQAAPLQLMITNDPQYVLMTREKIAPTLDIPKFQFTIVIESASYIYIDKNTTITADKFTYNDIIPDIPIGDILADTPIASLLADPMDIQVKLTVQKINLALKKGWNAIHSTFTLTVKPTTPAPPLTFGADGDVSISLGDPSSLKWVLNSGENELLPSP